MVAVAVCPSSPCNNVITCSRNQGDAAALPRHMRGLHKRRCTRGVAQTSFSRRVSEPQIDGSSGASGVALHVIFGLTFGLFARCGLQCASRAWSATRVRSHCPSCRRSGQSSCLEDDRSIGVKSVRVEVSHSGATIAHSRQDPLPTASPRFGFFSLRGTRIHPLSSSPPITSASTTSKEMPHFHH